MLRFKVDENLPMEVATLLRSAGYDADTVLDEALGGELDQNVAARCLTEQRVIVTLDTGFTDIRTYPPASHAGLIVLRLRRQDKPHVMNQIHRLLPILANSSVDRRLWIVEEGRIKVRK